MSFYNEFLLVAYVFTLLCIDISHGLRFDDFNNYYDGQQLQPVDKINAAIQRLEHAPQMVNEWPNISVKLGQVAGVALDNAGHLLVFHRAGNTWDASTFSSREVYQAIGEPPIPDPTILVLNDTGELVDMWGEKLFFMPHGITVDPSGNVWVTDVALHQVFKFTPDDRQKPALTLGEKFIPGNIDGRFCKPSAVAVLSNGDFFVADGYCNHRIIKFSPAGKIILQWGKQSGNDHFVFNVPHALTLAEDRGLICVADRERGRVACFRHDNGTYVNGFSSWLIGTRLFSVAYAPVHGGRLYLVNGPYGGAPPVRGYGIDFTSGRLVQTFAPAGGFRNPHDIVVSKDGSQLYVAELDPHRVVKFVDEALHNESRQSRPNVTARAKPTATSEVSASVSESPHEWWEGAGWALAGAAMAAALALAAVALRAARDNGRKGITRRRWEYSHGEFKLRRLLERRRFTRVHSDDSDDEPAPMLPQQPPANA